ncbi:MAG: hypothetical protein WA366_29340 [Pseudolabrys sp.]
MKSRLGTAVTAATVVAALASGAAAEEKLQKLSAGQIRAKMAGMELTDGVHWRELYGRGGTVTSDSMGRKRTGKWRVEKDQLCVEFDKDPPAKCYEVWMSGKTVELRREGLMPLQGVIEQPSGRK